MFFNFIRTPLLFNITIEITSEGLVEKSSYFLVLYEALKSDWHEDPLTDDCSIPKLPVKSLTITDPGTQLQS